MSTYSLGRQISTCYVTKEHLKEIESLILQYASDIEGDNYSVSKFSIQIEERTGVEELPSITTYRSLMFPTDTNAISLKYANYSSPTALMIKVKFSINSIDSILLFSLRAFGKYDRLA